MSYTFSRREKILLAVLAVLLVGLLWYVFIYQSTQSQLDSLDSQIQTTELLSDNAAKQLGQMSQMSTAIADHQAAGDRAVTLPEYDNANRLMAQLNTILANTSNYSLSFDDLDFSTAGLVRRGVTISFGCESMADGRAVIAALEDGLYPCSIDAASMVSNADRNARNSLLVGTNSSRTANSPYSVGLHVVFYETN